jgi:thiol-disulfide isomerase/thioredoxin
MKIKYVLLGALITLCIVVAAMVVVYKYRSEQSYEPETSASAELFYVNDYEIGRFKAVNGGQLANKDIYFVNFWATWCAPCRQEFGSLVALRQSIDTSRVGMYFVSTEEREKIQKFAQNNPEFKSLPFYSSLPELENKMIAQDSIFYHKYLPTTYIIFPKKKLGYKITSAINWNTNYMKALLTP